MYYAEETVNKLIASKDIVIYGARIVANEVANCFMGAPYFLNISAFMVSDKQGNPAELLGIPVIDVKEGQEKYKNATIVVAVLEKYADSIWRTLEEAGFSNVISLTFESNLWSEIRGNYYIEHSMSQGRTYLTLESELRDIEESNIRDSEKVSIYMAKCHVDRKLDADFSKYDWEKPIQVGAALTDQVITALNDNTGDNISFKNKQYCELTALYWIWKNDKASEYVGLCHYRRHFSVTKTDLSKLSHSDIDVILTIPILNFPNVRTVYEHDHMIADWDIMLKAISKLAPEYKESAEAVQNGIYYYAYNMFIAKKKIFDAYCEWLFPVLEYCEYHCEEKQDPYQARFIGFLAERLLSIFVAHHEKEWKIVHVQKEFFMR